MNEFQKAALEKLEGESKKGSYDKYAAAMKRAVLNARRKRARCSAWSSWRI